MNAGIPDGILLSWAPPPQEDSILLTDFLELANTSGKWRILRPEEALEIRGSVPMGDTAEKGLPVRKEGGKEVQEGLTGWMSWASVG